MGKQGGAAPLGGSGWDGCDEVRQARDRAARRLARLTAAGLLVGLVLYRIVATVGALDPRLGPLADWFATPLILVASAFVLAGVPDRLGQRWAHRAHQAFPVVVAAAVLAVAVTGSVTPAVLIAGAGLLVLAGALGGRSLVAVLPMVAALPILATVRGEASPEVAAGAAAVYFIVALTQHSVAVVMEGAVREQVVERDRARRLASQLEAVARGARAVTTLQVDDVLQAVSETATATDWQVAALYLVDQDGDHLRLAGHSNLPEDLQGAGLRIGEGLAGSAVQEGTTVQTPDYSAWPGRLDLAGAEKVRAGAAAPIQVDGTVVGAVAVGRTDDRPIDRGALIALELLAAQAGRALELTAHDERQLATIDELRRVERRQGEFLSAVSHEVRTPVTVLIGATETLVERWDQLADQQRRGLVRQAHLNAHALKRLVTSLLDGARLREGVLSVHLDQVALRPLLQQTVDRLRSLADHQTVLVDVSVDLVVTADADLISRVVENLLTNALKYAGEHACVVVGATSDPDGAARVFVADDGPGLDPDEVRHLGRRFYRGNQDGGDVPGVGLGLAFCQQVLDQHGSRLSVESTPGHGTTFSFDLPTAVTAQG